MFLAHRKRFEHRYSQWVHGGRTGGGSMAVSSLTLAAGGTIPWVSGTTTTIGAPALTPLSAKKCPGYVKNASSEPAAESFAATITGDTGDGILVPATLSGEVCIGTDGSITLLKAVKASWTSSNIVCTTLTGNAATTVSVSGCSGGHTGGGSVAVSSLTLAAGGTIPWVSGGSITIGAPTLTPATAKKCPGYVKNASSEPTAESFTATVTSDTGDGLRRSRVRPRALCASEPTAR